MPILKLYGLRSGEPDHVRAFRDQLKEVVASVKELSVTSGQVSVFLLGEFAPPGQGDVVIEVTMDVKPERDVRVQNILARRLLSATRAYLREHHREEEPPVEALVYAFDPAQQGFAANNVKPTTPN